MDNEALKIFERIKESFTDLVQGRFIESAGNFEEDMKLLGQREAEGWKKQTSAS
ncbi:MAG: hypothetical protein AAF546_11595 [Verrucomicrobiota bacterium]